MKELEAGEAVLSADRVYRYALRRTWEEELGTMLFIGLNPSTADEKVLDPTLRRCIRFAQREGRGSLLVGNLFAYRATDPTVMKLHDFPVGIENNGWLLHMAQKADLIVCGWGNHGGHLGRSEYVKFLLRDFDLKCLGRCRGGEPKHPLYLSSETPLVDFS